MTAILTDIDQLNTLTASVAEFAQAIKANASNSIDQIDAQMEAIETLIAAKREAADKTIHEVQENAMTEITTLQGLQNTLAQIRSGFAESAPVELPALQKAA